MDVLARWAPTGLSIRLIVNHPGADDLEDVRLEVRTDGGVPCRLLPGNRAPSQPVDLTRIPAEGSIWMNVEPTGPSGPVSSLDVEVRVGDDVAWSGAVPITGGDEY